MYYRKPNTGALMAMNAALGHSVENVLARLTRWQRIRSAVGRKLIRWGTLLIGNLP